MTTCCTEESIVGAEKIDLKLIASGTVDSRTGLNTYDAGDFRTRLNNSDTSNASTKLSSRSAEQAATGLTTADSLAILCCGLTAELKRHSECLTWRRAWRRVLAGESRYSCRDGWVLAVLVSLGLILTGTFSQSAVPLWYFSPSEPALCLQAAVLLLCCLLAVLLSVWLERRFSSEILLKAQRVVRGIDDLRASLGLHGRLYPVVTGHALSGCSTSLHRAYRDNRLVHVPVSLLVEGDRILLQPGEECLVETAAVDDDCVVLHPGDIFPASSSIEPVSAEESSARLTLRPTSRLFRVLASPCVSTLSLALTEGYLRPEPRLWRGARELLTTVLRIGSVVTVLLCLLGNVLLCVVQHQLPLIVFAIKSAQDCAVCVLCFLPLLVQVLLVFVVFWSDACLAALSTDHFQSRASAERGDSSASGDAEEVVRCVDVLDEEEGSWRPNVSPASAWSHLLNAGRDASLSLSGSASLSLALSTVTSLCCVDQQGVLSGAAPEPEKVAMLRRGSAGCDDGRLEVLALSGDSTARCLRQFDDPDWQQSLARLKPIGLAAMLTVCDWRHSTPHTHCARHCMSELWRAIGFRAEAKQSLSPVTRMSVRGCSVPRECVRRPKMVGAGNVAMEAVFLRQAGSVQLLSCGDCDLLLGHCSEYWDGSDLVTLQDNSRRRLLDFCHRHALLSHCLTFAYKPVTTYPAKDLSASCTLSLSSSRQHSSNVDRSVEPEEDTVLTSADAVHELVSDQVMLGAVTLQFQVLPDVVVLIDRLERVCVRFVHFSKENELRSRVFSEKMGLESGWNCHISLRDSPLATRASSSHSLVTNDSDGSGSAECSSDDDATSLIFDVSNRAKLPKGIAEVVPHLEHVDNVPLQVSLFTDCSPDSSLQMLKIMQCYGEVVCVLGSSANARNSALYCSADASLATRPLMTAGCEADADGAGVLSTLAEQLDTLACSLLTERSGDDLTLLWLLVLEARHWTARARLLLVLALGTASALSISLALSVLFQLPPPLSPAQSIFVCWIFIPLLGGSLMLYPRDCSLTPELPQAPEPQRWCQPQCFWHVGWCYGLRFLPSSAAPLVFLSSALYQLDCSSCPFSLLTLQCCCFLLFCLSSLSTAVSLQQRSTVLLSCRLHRHWAGLLVQMFTLFSAVVFAVVHGWYVGARLAPLADLAPHLCLGFLVWPVVQMVICEVVKHFERKHNLRSQKRARLEFDTKLGMNSPF